MTDKTADYQKAGFDGSLAPGSKPVFLIVDPARAYVDPECPLYAGVEDVAARIIDLKREAQEQGIPTIVTKVVHDDRALSGGVFVKKVPSLKWLRPDSPFSHYIEGLEPSGSDIEVTKQYASAFAGTSLQATLTAMGCDTVVVTGFSTSGCIRATATDVMQGGFIPLVVSDGVGDRLPEVHEANLFDIQAKIGEVVDSETVRDLFRACAKWPQQ